MDRAAYASDPAQSRGREFPIASDITRGEIRPMLAATFPLSDLRAAQQAFVDKKHTGNIVVVP